MGLDASLIGDIREVRTSSSLVVLHFIEFTSSLDPLAGWVAEGAPQELTSFLFGV
jgi:hypothetical protein